MTYVLQRVEEVYMSSWVTVYTGKSARECLDYAIRQHWKFFRIDTQENVSRSWKNDMEDARKKNG